MLNSGDVAAYRRDGYVVLPEWLGAGLTQEIQSATTAMLEGAFNLAASNGTYDLEPWHIPGAPAVRRIRRPHLASEFFWDLARHPRILDAIVPLIGPSIRLYGSKINIK